jgi:hypothetical protein
MNVHLIKANDCDQSLYSGLMALLSSFPGPMQFIKSEDLELDEDGGIVIYDSEEKEFTISEFPASAVLEEVSYPREVKVLSWQQLFNSCDKYRRRRKIPAGDHVILLTSTANEFNWFGAAQDTSNNYFIHTLPWQRFFGSGVEDRFPLAYEVVSWLLRRQMFGTMRESEQHLHHEARGCMMDFCKDKREIILKMRTGDICSSCMDVIWLKDLSRTMLNQAFQIYDEVSRFLKWRERATFLHQPGRIEFRGAMQKVFLTDFGGIEIKLNPMQRALYILFMRYEQGIELPRIQEYRNELEALYVRFSNVGDSLKMSESINRLCDPLGDNINIQLSRIRRSFREAVGEEMALHYSIEKCKDPGDFRFKISLNREWVDGLHPHS